MNPRRWAWLLGCWSLTAWAQGQVFALAGKSPSDVNFVAAWQGCADEAKRQGDTCLPLGVGGPAQARVQDAAITVALAQPLAGLAVSVSHSALLAQSALALAAQRQVPVITFDSDLEPAHQALRRAYVGPDNVALGHALGLAARAAHPRGGRLCLLSGDAKDPNLNQRVWGVRQALSQQATWPAGRRLRGEGGWREVDRCPWYSGDSAERALKQMSIALGEMKVDAFIAVGHWPTLQPALFRATVRPLQARLQGRQQDIFVSIGEPSEGQRQLMRDGLVRAYVAIDFQAMGRAAYLSMKRLALGLAVEPMVRTPTVLLVRP